MCLLSPAPRVPPGPWAPCPTAVLPLTCVTGWAFTGNSVLLFKKQKITTLLKASILGIEWKPLSRAFEALEEPACLTGSALQLHFSLSLFLFCVLEALNPLQFSKHLFTAPNLHFLPSIVLNTSSFFGSQPRCYLLQEAFSGSPSLGYILAPSIPSAPGSLPLTPPPTPHHHGMCPQGRGALLSTGTHLTLCRSRKELRMHMRRLGDMAVSLLDSPLPPWHTPSPHQQVLSALPKKNRLWICLPPHGLRHHHDLGPQPQQHLVPALISFSLP